jgi:transposase
VHIVNQVRSAWKRLSRKERRWVSDVALRGKNAEERMRAKVIRNLIRDEPIVRITSILQCSRSHVQRIAARFIARGLEGLTDGRADNGAAKVTEEYESAVLIAVACSPDAYGFARPTWTLELLILAAHQQTGIRVSTSTISRLLARHGARRGRPKPIVACPWKKGAKTRRLNQIRRLGERLRGGEALLHVDEVDIHLNPKIGPDWMLRGQQKKVLTPGKNEKRYLAGALNAMTGHVSYVAGPRKTSALFIRLIDHLLDQEYPRCVRLHVVLDNFRIHSSRAVEAASKRWGTRVTFHFLPPYCPDDNRIERLWKDLHDNVTRNHMCCTIDALMDRVYNYLHARRFANPELRKAI